MVYIFPNEADVYSLSAALTKGALTLRVLAPPNATGFAELSANMTTASFQYLSGGGYAGVTMTISAWCAPYFSANSAESSAVGPTAGSGFLFTFSAAPNSPSKSSMSRAASAPCTRWPAST